METKIYYFVYDNVDKFTASVKEATMRDLASLCEEGHYGPPYWYAGRHWFELITNSAMSPNNARFDGFVEAVNEEDAIRKVNEFFRWAFKEV